MLTQESFQDNTKLNINHLYYINRMLQNIFGTKINQAFVQLIQNYYQNRNILHDQYQVW